jgi:glucose/arabinose dehydrogenase
VTALSAFDDPSSPPTAEQLAITLGPAERLWSGLVSDIRLHAPDVTETWNHAGAKYGWSLRLVQGDRNLVHLTPQTGRMLVGVALGEKAIAAATASGLASARTLEVVALAPKYAEGRGVRFGVETDDDLAVAMELARIKLGR